MPHINLSSKFLRPGEYYASSGQNETTNVQGTEGMSTVAVPQGRTVPGVPSKLGQALIERGPSTRPAFDVARPGFDQQSALERLALHRGTVSRGTRNVQVAKDITAGKAQEAAQFEAQQQRKAAQAEAERLRKAGQAFELKKIEETAAWRTATAIATLNRTEEIELAQFEREQEAARDEARRKGEDVGSAEWLQKEQADVNARVRELQEQGKNQQAVKTLEGYNQRLLKQYEAQIAGAAVTRKREFKDDDRTITTTSQAGEVPSPQGMPQSSANMFMERDKKVESIQRALLKGGLSEKEEQHLLQRMKMLQSIK